MAKNLIHFSDKNRIGQTLNVRLGLPLSYIIHVKFVGYHHMVIVLWPNKRDLQHFIKVYIKESNHIHTPMNSTPTSAKKKKVLSYV